MKGLAELFESTCDLLTEGISVNKIRKAITQENVVVIFYDDPEEGDNILPGFRTIEPYVYGISMAGNDVIRAWLVGGTSRTGRADPSLVPGWRLFRVDRIKSWRNTRRKFFGRKLPREKYNPRDHGMIRVFNYVPTQQVP